MQVRVRFPPEAQIEKETLDLNGTRVFLCAISNEIVCYWVDFNEIRICIQSYLPVFFHCLCRSLSTLIPFHCIHIAM